MNDGACQGLRAFDLGQKLCCTDPINGCGPRQRVIEQVFEVLPAHECSHDRGPRAEERWI